MPRKRRNSHSLATPMPHFSAIMLQFPIPGHELMIPVKSAMKFGKDLSEVATLIVPNGRSWQVRLKKDGKKIWLHEGLQEFVEYYSVQYFYNLHFRYERNSVFYVCICDASGSEIDYPCDSPNRGHVVPDFRKHHEEHIGGDDSVEILDTKPSISLGLRVKDGDEDKKDVEVVEILDIKPFASNGGAEQDYSRKNHIRLFQQKIGRHTSRCQSHTSKDPPTSGVAYWTSRSCRKEKQADLKEPANDNVPGRGQAKEKKRSHARAFPAKEDVEMLFPRSFSYTKSRRLMNSKETERAVRAASVCKLKNPSFMVILRSYNLCHSYVNMPEEFVRRHLNQCSEDIQLQANNGRRKWPARCYYQVKDGLITSVKKIGKGWGPFSADNNLQEGDVCVFELTKKGKDVNVLRVWIYHAADYARSAQKRFKAK